MDTFPFTELPPELALEIIRVAASPQFQLPSVTTPRRRPYYATALALSAVSYRIRLVTMPHLLHTVVLNSDIQTFSFNTSITLQHSFQQTSSRLALDYKKLVRRLWSTECWESLIIDDLGGLVDYSPMYEVIRNVRSLGFTTCSQYLLYSGLEANPRDWTCRCLTVTGLSWRWNPLISTSEGQAFLQKVTHLVVSIASKPKSTNRLPSWLKNVPFKYMPALTHFAFPTFTLSRVDPGTCRGWIETEHPELYEILKDVEIRPFPSLGEENKWELAFLRGTIWPGEDG